ncbi:ceramide glucosyltransferase [Macrobrachium rosenbergii]|uniref:ceramide glucosyltransferase n=1 Tax=Macrobrachium rosenbergii TaxID=79674 RepID=UPI0034D76734
MLRPTRRVAAWILDKDWANTLNNIGYQSWAWNFCVLLLLSSAAHHNLPRNTPPTGGSSGAPNTAPTTTSAGSGGWTGSWRLVLDSLVLVTSTTAASVTTSGGNSGWVGVGALASIMPDAHLAKVVLAAGILVFWMAFWIIHLIGIIYGYRKLHRRGTQAVDGGEPGVLGVSILKPLVGSPMDPNLMTNLETFFTLNYPKYELLFCVQEEGDPSIMLVKQLMKKHPHVDASCFTGGLEVGVNPKINNMQPGYLAAKHELILISDSGLMMKEDTLTDMVDHMTADVGIVHQMPFTCDRKGWPAILEKVFFGTSHARMYLFLGLLDALGFGVNCCTGMSCLMRKKVLDEAGGISAFGIYLAEDYFFAKYIQDRGWGIRISSQPAWQNAGISRVKSFLSRLTRWCKLRVAMVPHTIVLEPFSECMILGLVASWAATVLFHADYLTFFLFHTLTWSLADWIMLNIVQNGPPPFSKFEFVISWCFREVSAIFIFLHAIWNPVITWRTGSYKLRWWGVAEPVNTRVTVM